MPLTEPLESQPVQSNVTPFVAPKPDHATLGPIMVEDIDRLWDWCRSDQPITHAFLGASFSNSRELFEFIGHVSELERTGAAAMFAIREGATLRGFVLINPILRSGHALGTLSLYLEPEARPRLKAILSSILVEADRVAPGVNLCVVTQAGEWASLLESLGFTSHTVLTRPASPTGER